MLPGLRIQSGGSGPVARDPSRGKFPCHVASLGSQHPSGLGVISSPPFGHVFAYDRAFQALVVDPDTSSHQLSTAPGYGSRLPFPPWPEFCLVAGWQHLPRVPSATAAKSRVILQPELSSWASHLLKRGPTCAEQQEVLECGAKFYLRQPEKETRGMIYFQQFAFCVFMTATHKLVTRSLLSITDAEHSRSPHWTQDPASLGDPLLLSSSSQQPVASLGGSPFVGCSHLNLVPEVTSVLMFTLL